MTRSWAALRVTATAGARRPSRGSRDRLGRRVFADVFMTKLRIGTAGPRPLPRLVGTPAATATSASADYIGNAAGTWFCYRRFPEEMQPGDVLPGCPSAEPVGREGRGF